MLQLVERHGVRCTAYHEAGHAVAAVLLNIPFERVWILRRESDTQGQGQILGQVVRNLHLPHFAGIGEENAKQQVVQIMAGPWAETLAYPDLPLDLEANQDDVDTAKRILKFALCTFKVSGDQAAFDPVDQMNKQPLMDRIRDESEKAAGQFVQEHRESITRVAEALLTQWELSHAEVATLCAPG